MRLAVLLALPLFAACLVPPTYQVQRSARVPHAAVPLRSGEPLAGPAELSLGASNTIDVRRPRVGDRGDAVEVPEHQARGELRIRIQHNAELALIHERGLGSSAMKPDPTQAPIGDGSPYGTGFAFRYSAALDTNLRIGLAVEALLWSIPYVEYRVCVANCEYYDPLTVERDTALEGTLGVGITPSYQLGRLTLFGGVFAREHPTIERKGLETGYTNSEDVTEGVLNVLVHAGAAFRFDDTFSALLLVDQNVSSDPVRYGPGIGFALSATMR